MIQIYELYFKKKQLFFVRKIVLSFLILSCFSLSFRANVPVKNWLHGNVCEGQLFVTQENVRFYTTKLYETWYYF